MCILAKIKRPNDYTNMLVIPYTAAIVLIRTRIGVNDHLIMFNCKLIAAHTHKNTHASWSNSLPYKPNEEDHGIETDERTYGRGINLFRVISQ